MMNKTRRLALPEERFGRAPVSPEEDEPSALGRRRDRRDHGRLDLRRTVEALEFRARLAPAKHGAADPDRAAPRAGGEQIPRWVRELGLQHVGPGTSADPRPALHDGSVSIEIER